MKTVILAVLAFMTLSTGFASAQTAERLRTATMPSSMIYEYGSSSPSLASPTVIFGETGDPISLVIEYAREGNQLGSVQSARWLARDLGRLENVEAFLVISKSSGQVWRSSSASLSANKNGPGIITDGYETLASGELSALFAEFENGGEFVFVLEDESGRRWGPTRSILPSPTERQRLFELNLEAIRNHIPMIITPAPRAPQTK